MAKHKHHGRTHHEHTSTHLEHHKHDGREVVDGAAEPTGNKYDYHEHSHLGVEHASQFGKFINYGPDCPGNNGKSFDSRHNLKDNEDLFEGIESETPGGQYNNSCFDVPEADHGDDGGEDVRISCP